MMVAQSSSDPQSQVRAILLKGVSGERPQQDLSFELAVAALRAAGIATEAIEVGPKQASELTHAQAEQPASLIYLHFSRLNLLPVGREIAVAYAASDPCPVLVASGHFTSDDARALLDALEDLDAVIFGEIEVTLVAVVRTLQEKRAWWEEPGLWRRHGDLVDRTSPRPPIENLDSLPMAAVDFARPGESRRILVGRGCNSDCSYCSLQVPYRDTLPSRQQFWRSRSPCRVVDEMEQLWQERGISRFVLSSFVFFGYDGEGTRMVEGLVREILARRLPIHFSLVTHPGHLRRNLPLLPSLRQAGLDWIFLGIDSILDRARSLYGVPFDLEDIRATLTGLHEQSVRFHTGYIFYDPYLTLEEVGEILSFFRSIRPLYSHIDAAYGLLLHKQILTRVLQLGRGMPILEKLRKDGLLIREGTLEHVPLARFRDPSVGRFFHLHRRFNHGILRQVAQLVFRSEAEKRFPELPFFLLDALEQIRQKLAFKPEIEESEILTSLRIWACRILAPIWAAREADFPPIQEVASLVAFFNGDAMT
jgi:hypothetical protein